MKPSAIGLGHSKVVMVDWMVRLQGHEKLGKSSHALPVLTPSESVEMLVDVPTVVMHHKLIDEPVELLSKQFGSSLIVFLHVHVVGFP